MRDLRDQLTKYLTDAHSIEEQALAQLRRAPAIAGDPRIAAAFEEHLGETEGHEREIRELLDARGRRRSDPRPGGGDDGSALRSLRPVGRRLAACGRHRRPPGPDWRITSRMRTRSRSRLRRCWSVGSRWSTIPSWPRYSVRTSRRPASRGAAREQAGRARR